MNYFDDEKNVESLSEIFESWKGTPFLLCKGVKGRGVDCSQLLGKTFEEASILTHVENPLHRMTWFIHTSDNQVLFDLVKKHLDEYLSNGIGYEHHLYDGELKLIYGDILFFTMQAGSPIKNHLGIYTGDDKILHSVQNRKVHERILTKHFYNNLTDIFRITKDGE